MTAPAFRSIGTLAATATPGAAITPGTPAGAADGDLLILRTCFNNDGSTATVLSANGTGWTLLASEQVVGGRQRVTTYWWRRVSGSVPPMPSVQNTTSDVDGCWADVVAFTGVATSGDPFEGLQVKQVTTSTDISGSEITSTGANRLGVQSTIIYDNNADTGTPSGWTSRSYVLNAVANDATFILDTKEILTAGVEPAAARTNAATDATVIFSFALKPVEAAATAITPANAAHSHSSTSPSLTAKASATVNSATHAHSAQGPSLAVTAGTASTLDYEAVASSPADAATYSFTGLAFGAAAVNRYLVAAIAWRSAGTTNDITSVTIGGVTATRIGSAHNTGGSNMSACDMYIAAVPTGTSGDVVVNTTTIAVRMGVAVYCLVGIASPTPDQVGTGSTGTTTSSASITTTAESHVIGIAFNGTSSCQISSAHGDVAAGTLDVSVSNGSSSTTWTGLTEDSDQFIESVNGTYSALIVAAWTKQSGAAGTAITPADAAHSHAATSPTLAAASSVTVNAGTHAQAATEPAIGAKSSVTVDAASHTHAATAPTLAAASSVAANDAAHGHTAATVTISAGGSIAPDSTAHAHTATTPSTSFDPADVTPDNATHGHASTGPALNFDPADALVSSATHGHEATSPSVASKATATPNNGAHNHTATEPSLTVAGSLAVNSASHGHTAQSPAIAAHSTVTVQAALHGHSAGNPALTAKGTASPQNGAHGHAATSPAMSGSLAITVSSGLHAHVGTSPALAAKAGVAVNDNGQGHTASSPSITGHLPIAVDNSSHGQAASAPALAVRFLVAANDGKHGHEASVAVLRIAPDRPATAARPTQVASDRPTQPFSNRPTQMSSARPRQSTASRPRAVSTGRR